MDVRVVNTNIHPYRERFRDKDIVIEANSHILMDQDEAYYFLETFCPPVKDAQGRRDPKFFKKLNIHPEDLKKIREDAVKNANPMVCHANGQKAATKEELAQLLGNFSHMLADRDDSAESEVKKANKDLKKENKELKSRLEIIEEKLGLRDTEDAISSTESL